MASPTRLRVLVLEDEWLVADQFESALADAGFEVVGPVGRVAEALELLRGQAVDAAILDINVHGQRSFSVADELSRHATPFVFLSGYSDVELPAALSGRPLLEKPVNSDSVRRAIGALLPPASSLAAH
jgi:DNA-binding response OmpR family regulator